MATVFEPPPTYAEVVLINAEKQPGDPGFAKFNPIWLKWFVDVAAFLSGAGGGGVEHNLTTGLQGGTAGQYYHITAALIAVLNGTKTANTVLAGPTSGAAAVAAFRALVSADLPAITHNSTTSIQGGAANDYYHFTAAEHTMLLAGITATITTAKITGGGANGSMTFVGGLLTAQTPAT